MQNVERLTVGTQEANLRKITGGQSFVHRRKRVGAAFALCLGICVAFNAFAETAEPNVVRGPAPDTAATVAIDQLRLSDMLADFGERNADAVALIEAAKIRKLLPPPLNTGADDSVESRSWQSLLARAAQLAGPNPAVAGLLKEVRGLKARDIPVIPLQIHLLHKRIKQNAADRAEVHFSAGEVAMVYIRPVSTANLELFIYDDLNNLICSGAGSGPDVGCRWRPRHNGSFLIDVRNNAGADVDYELAINREIVQR
jgi:hypothetical protein